MNTSPAYPPAAPLSLAPEEISRLQEEIRALAPERDAVILAHNYQVPEIQDVADYVGDGVAGAPASGGSWRPQTLLSARVPIGVTSPA